MSLSPIVLHVREKLYRYKRKLWTIDLALYTSVFLSYKKVELTLNLIMPLKKTSVNRQYKEQRNNLNDTTRNQTDKSITAHSKELAHSLLIINDMKK